MASSDRHRPTALIQALRQRPGDFDFFQAMRILAAAAGPGAAAVGGDNPPEREFVRLRSAASRAFAVGDVHRVTPPTAAGGAWTMEVDFFGMVGAAGTLPQHYTETVRDRLQQRDPTLRDWLTVFEHRLLSLFYRAGTKYRPPQQLTTAAAKDPATDRFTSLLLALIGRGLPALQNQGDIPDSTLLFQGGHFARHTRTADGLAQVVADSFDIPVQVEEFVGRWLGIPRDEQCRLESRPRRGTVRACLGQGAVLGPRVWDVQSKVRLHLGPLTFLGFEHLCSGGTGHAALLGIIRDYLGLETDFELRYHLAPGESPGVVLGRPTTGSAARLGANTWLERGQRSPAARSATLRTGQPSFQG